MTVTKEDIVTSICNETHFRRFIVSSIVDSLLESIIKSMSDGNKVQFSGFGTFEPKRRAGRTGRNPRTNEPVEIPACISPSFKAGKSMTSAIKREI